MPVVNAALGRIPGIFDGSVEARLVGGAHGELIHIGLAQHDGAGRLEPRHDRRIIGRYEIVQHARTAAGAYPIRAENIFMNEGDAEQRTLLPRGAAAIGRGRGQQGLLGREGDQRIQGGVQALDPAQEMPREFDARNLPRT